MQNELYNCRECGTINESPVCTECACCDYSPWDETEPEIELTAQPVGGQ